MTRTLRKLAIAAIAFLGLAAPSQAAEDYLQKFIDNFRAPFDSEVELGVWHGDLDKCKELADKHGIPMIAVWSNKGCAHCEILEKAMMSDAFNNWAKSSGLILCFTCSEDPKGKLRYNRPDGDNNTIGKSDGAYYWFCKRPNLLKNYPYVRFYWYEDGKKKVDYSVHGDKVDGQQGIANGTYDKAGNNCIKYIVNTSGFQPYLESPKTLSSYLGGTFASEESEGNRLEAEEGTTGVTFKLARTGQAVEAATNNIVELVAPDGSVKQTVTVQWTAGQEEQDVTVDASLASFTENGQKALLVVKGMDGAAQATNSITYVTGSGESPANPLWIGERVATGSGVTPLSASLMTTAKPALAFGEWTMDIEVAKQKVAAAEGDAYTLVAVEGALWCPDCANTERNFIDVKDGDGVSKFSKWAKDNQVALVAIDVPPFSTNSTDGISRPTLLSRNVFSSTLARVSEYPASGADGALTNSTARSGLGYLTRKGASDDDAAAVLERNRKLVSTDFSEGGVHSAADSSPYRTGVPIFVVLDKAGNVKARLTRFASVSPMAADQAEWDNMIKRFDEMLAIAKGGEHDDGGVLGNDYPAAGVAGFKANGGSASGEISHVDVQDVYALQDFSGNALLKTTVTGASDAEVTVSYLTLDGNGKKQTVGTPATGILSGGVSLEYEFTTAGEYFVEVKGAVGGDDFNVANTKSANFHSYSVAGAVVFVPQEAKASGTPPAGSDKVTMRLEKDLMYRIEGLKVAEVGDALAPSNAEDPYCIFYTALATGDAELTTTKKDVTVSYQKWVPGKIGFVAEKKTVQESAGEVAVVLSRTDGASGEVKVKVSLDEEATTLYNSEGEARFEFAEATYTLDEGWIGETNVTIKVLDDTRFDGSGDVVLKLEKLEDENGDTVLTATNYVLSVTENDKQSAGEVAFTGVEPFFSKKGTVYAKESDGATIYAERLTASDGSVTVKLNATNGAKTEIGGVETNVIAWANHKYDKQAVKVTGVPAGKSAKVTLSSPTDGLKVVSASSSVTVVSVADDAPSFAQDACAATIYRYVAVSNIYPVVLAEGTDGAKLTFTKVSGTLPSGLKATWDKDANAMAIAGTSTAKPGSYTIVYQVTQTVGSKKTPGLTIELSLTLADPTAVGGEELPYNEAVAAQNSRTFKDIAVIDTVNERLMGLLQVTVPKTGKVSAKYTCSTGSVSFTAKGWSDFDDSTKVLVANPTTSKKGYALEVCANDDGSIAAKVTDPNAPEGSELVATCGGDLWSKANPAEAWRGYYTVALVGGAIKEAEGSEGVASRGNGYLTLKMNTTSAVLSGLVTWAGMLPNGTSVSGSAVLCPDKTCDGLATLPVYKRSSTDIIAAVVELCENGIIRNGEAVKPYWLHTDRYEATSYQVDFDAYGGEYVATTNLAEVCRTGYETTDMTLAFDISGLAGWTSGGTPSEVASVPVAVEEKTMKVASGNDAKATLRFARTTGIVSGTFKLPCVSDSGTKTVTANYKGVVLFGWGPGCECGDPVDSTTLPFVVGSYYITDKATVEDANGMERSVSLKRGGTVTIDKKE